MAPRDHRYHRVVKSNTNPADRARQRFTEEFGVAPAVVAVSPGRVNLIGEHTDYNAGLCLPIALPHVTAAAAAARPDGVVRVSSLDVPGTIEVELAQVAPGNPAGWAGYVAGTLWALVAAGYPVSGMNIVVASDVPVGAGLSSSAALEGAVAMAADALFSFGLAGSDESRRVLVAACQRAENEIVGAPTGGLDQTASLLARDGQALLLDFADGSAAQVPFDLASHGLELVVIDTQAHHSLADGQYGKRRAECEEAARILGVATLREAEMDHVQEIQDPVLRRRALHVVSEIDRVVRAQAALERNDFAALGSLFNASHSSLRDDYEVSCAELDVACDAALAAGALGARMTGGGFGGSAIALVPVDRSEAVTGAVQAAFADAGFTAPRIFAATASAGARLV